MEADVLSAIKSQIAYLSGSRQSPLFIVNATTFDSHPSNKETLEVSLEYLASILRWVLCECNSEDDHVIHNYLMYSM